MDSRERRTDPASVAPTVSIGAGAIDGREHRPRMVRTQVTGSTSGVTTRPVQPAGQAGTRPETARPAALRPRQMLPWIVAAIVAVCLLGSGAVGLILLDPFGWSGEQAAAPEASPTPVSEALPPAATPAPSATSLPAPSLAPPSPTIPIVAAPPTTENLPSPSPLLPAPVQNTATPTILLPPPEPAILVEDDFSRELSRNWLAWGQPFPTIDHGPSGDWLYLKAVEDPYAAGVTSKFSVPAEPGVEVHFSASLDRIYVDSPLLFDWSPGRSGPGPENPVKGPVHLEIRKSGLELSGPVTGFRCQYELDGLELNEYLLRFTEGGGIELTLKDSEMPVCQAAQIGVAPQAGLITFTGAGWITYVKVATP